MVNILCFLSFGCIKYKGRSAYWCRQVAPRVHSLDFCYAFALGELKNSSNESLIGVLEVLCVCHSLHLEYCMGTGQSC